MRVIKQKTFLQVPFIFEYSLQRNQSRRRGEKKCSITQLSMFSIFWSELPFAAAA